MKETKFARTLSAAGADVWKVERAPNGRALCRFCKVEVPKGRRTFCGDLCVHEWRIRNSSGYARDQVLRRDEGRCSACDRDTESIRERLQDRMENLYSDVLAEHARSKRWQKLLHRLGLLSPTSTRTVRSLWQMDHIVPVIEGGGSCGLENLRTLCIPCHKAETKALAKRRAQARRQQSSQQP